MVKKISDLSFQEAKAKGILKNWERARKIKKSMLEYHRRQRILKEQFKEDILKTKEKIKTPQTFIRRQVVQDFKSSDLPYFCSIRAITINPEYNQTALNLAILKAKKTLESHYDINFRTMFSNYTGLEQEKISKSEAKYLLHNRIHIEVFIAYANQESKINTEFIF